MSALTVIPESQRRILKALGKYQYLTRAQLAALGIGGASNLYAGLRALSDRKHPLIARRELLSKVVYGLIKRRRDPGVLRLRI